jgi:hypothetical protein
LFASQGGPGPPFGSFAPFLGDGGALFIDRRLSCPFFYFILFFSVYPAYASFPFAFAWFREKSQNFAKKPTKNLIFGGDSGIVKDVSPRSRPKSRFRSRQSFAKAPGLRKNVGRGARYYSFARYFSSGTPLNSHSTP